MYRLIPLAPNSAPALSQKYFLFPKTAPALEATEPECTSTGAGLCEDYDEEGEEAAFIH